MSSDFELHDLSNKFRPSSTPPAASADAGPVPPLTRPEESGDSTTASWAWAASAMFVAQVYHLRDILDSDQPPIQLVCMVVCPHFPAACPPIRYRHISAIDATRGLPSVTFRPSIGIFGCGPHCQCDQSSFAHIPSFRNQITEFLSIDAFL
jgi:hypothetical protein